MGILLQDIMGILHTVSVQAHCGYSAHSSYPTLRVGILWVFCTPWLYPTLRVGALWVFSSKSGHIILQTVVIIPPAHYKYLTHCGYPPREGRVTSWKSLLRASHPSSRWTQAEEIYDNNTSIRFIMIIFQSFPSIL